MLAVDNQATGLLFIHDNIGRRIDAHRAFRALFPFTRKHGTQKRPWLGRLMERRPTEVAADANKIARMA